MDLVSLSVLERNELPHAWIGSAGIWSAPGGLDLFGWSIAT